MELEILGFIIRYKESLLLSQQGVNTQNLFSDDGVLGTYEFMGTPGNHHLEYLIEYRLHYRVSSDAYST